MKKLLYIDMDDVLCDFTKAYEEMLIKEPSEPYPQSVQGFFQNLIPIEGGLKAVELLAEKYEIYILTAPSTRNPLCYTEKRLWIESHMGYEMVKRLIISPNKSLLKGDLLIDDHIDGRGQDDFEGELIHFGSPRFLGWKEVLQYLV